MDALPFRETSAGSVGGWIEGLGVIGVLLFFSLSINISFQLGSLYWERPPN